MRLGKKDETQEVCFLDVGANLPWTCPGACPGAIGMETIEDKMEMGDEWRRNGDEDKDDGDGDKWKNGWR